MKKVRFYLALFLAVVMPLTVFAASGGDSNISYKGNALLCGKTYTSSDISGIKSGSLTISDDGTEMTFNNLDISDESSLFTLNAKNNDIVVRLKGENKIVTTGLIVMRLYYGTITFTGDGSLTTRTNWFDFVTGAECDIVIDNTTLTCEGPTAFGNNNRRLTERLIVKNSTLIGRMLFGLESLMLIKCAFISPVGAYFDKNSGGMTQLKDDKGSSVGIFEIQPLEGDFNNRVTPSDFGNIIVSKGETKTVDISMTNVGIEPVSEISYVLTIGGIAQPVQTQRFSEPQRTGKQFMVPISLTPLETPGVVKVQMAVTKVNGKANTAEQTTANGTVNTLISGEASHFQYQGISLVSGHTYTPDDLGDIKSGSLTISDDGTSMTFDNLYIDSPDANLKGDAYHDYVVILKGESTLYTTKTTALNFKSSKLTLTGGGSLTTKSSWIDIYAYSTDIYIENVTIICEGGVAFGDNMLPVDNVIVKNSTVKGKRIVRMGALTLIDCAFVSPKEVFFHPDLITELQSYDVYGSQLCDAEGNMFGEFEIQPVEGDFSNRVGPWDPRNFADVIVEKGKTATVSIKMKNDGEEPISKVSYKLSVDGNAMPEQTYTLSEANVTTGKAFYIPVSFPSAEEVGVADAVVTVTKVNGKKNTSPRNATRGVIATIDEASARRVVFEEYTGTWCGWCPRGMVAVDMLNKEFGDSVITMVADSYPTATMSFPDSRVNRNALIDPYLGSSNTAYGIRDDVARELAQTASAGIALTANWADEGQSIIKAKTETTFLTETDVTQYGIAYALLEDGMTGTGSSWAQKNYYAGNSINDPNLQPYTLMPSAITEIEYDHVAVAVWGIEQGVLYVPQKNVYKCDISENTLIQDKSKLSLVAMLIDRKTGKIVNAAKAAVDQFEESAVIDVHAEVYGSSDVYTVNGYRVASSPEAISTLPKGIYIVGGRKVVVK